MNKVFFRVIIPNYNNASWLEKSIGSVLNQTFTDYQLFIVDDKSDDNSVDVIKNVIKDNDKVTLFVSDKKLYNGGTRNVGLDLSNGISEYTLFLDSDDWFCRDTVLQELYDVIINNNMPDCVSLSYNCLIGNNESYQELIRNTPNDLVSSVYVACWTKCIKSDLVVKFPENTLMEDVVQHIAQSDRIESIVSYTKPMVVWNRNNTNSCSRVENQDCQNGKWQSSMYRYAADLMDLECTHDYCEEHRKWRLGIVLNNIKNDVYVQ